MIRNMIKSQSLINIDYMILIVCFMLYIHDVTLFPGNDFHKGPSLNDTYSVQILTGNLV